MPKRIKKKDFMYYSGKKYEGMMSRCYRETERTYKQYGGKGIRVCKEWIVDINAFRLWLLKEITRIGISQEYYLLHRRSYQMDRIDPKGHYTPENCRLVTRQVNARNKSKRKKMVLVSAEGDQIQVAEQTTKELNERVSTANKLRTLVKRAEAKAEKKRQQERY